MPRAHYMSAYEKSEEKRAEEAWERERRKMAFFTAKSGYAIEYGYQLNVNNTVINAFYEDTVKRRKLNRPPFSDSQRRAWESCLWRFLRKQYLKYDKKSASEVPKELSRTEHMSEVLFGWRLDYFELYINNILDISSATKLFAREEEKIDYGNCKDI